MGGQQLHGFKAGAKFLNVLPQSGISFVNGSVFRREVITVGRPITKFIGECFEHSPHIRIGRFVVMLNTFLINHLVISFRGEEFK